MFCRRIRRRGRWRFCWNSSKKEKARVYREEQRGKESTQRAQRALSTLRRKMRREEGSKMGSLVNIRMGEGSAEMAEEKERGLLARLGELRSVTVALSGGADSAYLAWAAHGALGEKGLSVTALSESYSAYDREQGEVFLKAT